MKKFLQTAYIVAINKINQVLICKEIKVATVDKKYMHGKLF